MFFFLRVCITGHPHSGKNSANAPHCRYHHHYPLECRRHPLLWQVDATTKRLQSVRHAELKLQVLLRMTQPIVPMSPMPFPAALPSNSWKVKALREVKLQFWPGAKSVRAGIPTDAEVWAAITYVRIPTRR